MIIRKLLNDESGVTIAVETIILFSISIIFLGMIFMSFQDMTQRQNKILIEEQLVTIGNSMAKKMSDMEVEASASNTMGSHTTIKTEFWLPALVGDSSYTIKLMAGKILLESQGTPYVSVEVPVSADINMAENHILYSMDEKHALEYDSKSSTIYFTDGGAIPLFDFYDPYISIDAPADGTNISNFTYINTTPVDDRGVTRVEFYVNDAYRYTTGSPYKWLWDTNADLDGEYTVMAVAYDAAGHTGFALRNFTIYNPVSYPPAISGISPPDLTSTDFRKPTIQATISDDKAIDFSAFIFKVDNNDVMANATFDNVSYPKVTILSYTPTQNMPIGRYNVTLRAVDKDNTTHEKWANWSFEVINMTTDGVDPTVTIDSPTGILNPGTPIIVKYTASDLESGLDNRTIYVRRGDGLVYTNYKLISVYPTVWHDKPETYQFNSGIYYISGYNYTYNVTVFDRSGRSKPSTPVGPLTLSSGQAGQFEVDTSSYSSLGKKHLNIRIKDNVSGTLDLKLTNLTVSWNPTSTDKITSVKIGGNTLWTGSADSGIRMNFSNPYSVQPTTFQSMDLTFNNNKKSPADYTIVFFLEDTTTRTVTFYVATGT